MDGNFIKAKQDLYQTIDDLIEAHKESGSKEKFILPPEETAEFLRLLDIVSLNLMEDEDNFFGYFLFQMGWKIRFDLASPTAVNFVGAQYVIYFNPIQFLPMSLEQMETSIKHEILHIVSLHLLRQRDLKDHYSKRALNMAMDIVVNTYLIHLPPDAITLKLVSDAYDLDLQPFETFEYYADRIQEAIDRLGQTRDAPEEGTRSEETIETTFDPDKTHELWEESEVPDDQTLEKFTEKFVDAAMKGKVTDYLEGMIANLKKKANALPWYWYLRKIMGSIACEHKKTTTRRNRRQPERLDLRGHLRNYKAKIYIALDVSGSISDSEFDQAMEEVLDIVKGYDHEITMIECDNQIRRTYTVETMRDLRDRINIRGGTSYEPVIEYANKHYIDLLIYFTDGKGEDELKVKPQGYKILWVISGNGEDLSVKNPYGIVKKLDPLKVYDPLPFDDVEKGGFSMNHQEDISMPID